MNSSHYPPGVTGREPQIAGYPETSMEVDCVRQEAVCLYKFEVLEEVALVIGRVSSGADPDASLLDLQQLLQEDAEETTAECDWSGEADGYVEGDEFIWTCPRCGSDNTHMLDTGPDPDDARELARDLALDD